MGCRFDCAYEHELRQIFEITNVPLCIIFAHPCKYISHIKYANKINVELMTFDNEEELIKIHTYFPNARLLLRIAVEDSQSLCKFNTKFGCKIENVEKLILVARNLNLNLQGFSFHVGSGCKSSTVYYRALKICYEAMCIADKYNYQIKIINICGGFIAAIDDDGISIEDMSIEIKKVFVIFFITKHRVYRRTRVLYGKEISYT